MGEEKKRRRKRHGADFKARVALEAIILLGTLPYFGPLAGRILLAKGVGRPKIGKRP